jgi:hypothetical protein
MKVFRWTVLFSLFAIVSTVSATFAMEEERERGLGAHIHIKNSEGGKSFGDTFCEELGKELSNLLVSSLTKEIGEAMWKPVFFPLYNEEIQHTQYPKTFNEWYQNNIDTE